MFTLVLTSYDQFGAENWKKTFKGKNAQANLLKYVEENYYFKGFRGDDSKKKRNYVFFRISECVNE